MRTPEFWQHRGATSALLSPLAALYAFGARWDRTHTRPQQAPLPILSIGNAVAGGAGKTPTAIALAHLLRSMGATPHILSRGYGGQRSRDQQAAPHAVHMQDDWRAVGDEALLLATAAPTWVGRNRLASAEAALAAGASLALADDALQHHALKKDISLMVVDAAYGFGNGRVLPAGPLREPLADALARTDAIVLIGEDTRHLAHFLAPKPILSARLVPVLPEGVAPSEALRGTRVFAFAGIARPEKFYATLRGCGAELVETVNFADHHPFTEAEIRSLIDRARAHGAIPITTAKDAVKIPPALRPQIGVLEVALQFDQPQMVAQWLMTRFLHTIRPL